MAEIRFTVWGEPVAQGRPKFARIGNHVTTYDPEKSRTYKSIVRDEAIKVKPDKPLEGPLILTVAAYKSIPKSLSKKKTQQALEGELRPTIKPDLDNVVKGIKDALKGIIWRDDSQVIWLFASKWYSDKPRVEVEVEEV
ncbi:MAG: Endodeoxyribonuclease RusA [Pelotomaculum sp. PtaB.Bin104]|nr:MAG: Endodeoxyribonuclease RusA [Pelotomaculum sp. PtaB.Bin104]